MKFNYLLFLFIVFSVASKSQIVAIPYNDKIKVPVITLDINGRHYRFIVDMGAEVTIVNSRYIQLPEIDKIKANDANNSSKTIFKSKVNNLNIGSIAITNATVYSTEMNEPIFSCNEIAGILGMDILGDYVIELDPTEKVFAFYKESPFKKEEMLPFSKKGNRPSIDIMINNQLITLLLDTGSSGFIRISDKSGFKYDHAGSQKLSGYSAIGLNGRKEGLINSEVTKGDVTIGSNTDHDQVVLVEPTNSSKLGFEYLKHFHLVVSPKDRMLGLKKIEDFQLTDMLTKFGFMIGIDDNAYVITKLNANRTDLEVGDKVIEVNNQPIVNICELNKIKGGIDSAEVAPVLVIERAGKRLSIGTK